MQLFIYLFILHLKKHSRIAIVVNYEIRLFEAGDRLDDEPEFILRLPPDSAESRGIIMGYGNLSRPYDINGDGFNDLITGRSAAFPADSGHPRMEIYFGGDDFDTIPDLSFSLGLRKISYEYSSGYDVNGDGYDDILARYYAPYEGDVRDPRLHFALYLGGDPMDTVEVWEMPYNRFDGNYGFPREMTYGFSMVPDLNSDGFEDWVIGFTDPDTLDQWGYQGWYVFYGSDEPDSEPDLTLYGPWHAWASDIDLTGGDYNADGIGDLIAVYEGANYGQGQIDIRFGTRWGLHEETDLAVNVQRTYGVDPHPPGIKVGARGDYNGDGIPDFLLRVNTRRDTAIILAGNRDWRVDVPDDPAKQVPETFDFRLRTFPNPFNESVTITCKIPLHGRYKMAVYDISGRLHKTLFAGEIEPGEYAVNWNETTAGIYLVAIYSEGRVLAVTKTVCLP